MGEWEGGGEVVCLTQSLLKGHYIDLAYLVKVFRMVWALSEKVEFYCMLI